MNYSKKSIFCKFPTDLQARYIQSAFVIVKWANHALLTIFAGFPLIGGLERPLIGKPWFDSFVTQGKVTSTRESS